MITVINATDETVTQPADDYTVSPPLLNQVRVGVRVRVRLTLTHHPNPNPNPNQAADGVTVQAVRATPLYKLAPIKTSAARSPAASEPSPELRLRGA